MLDRPGFEFSFSGLKTAVMLAVRAAPLSEQSRADVAWAVQDAIVATLWAGYYQVPAGYEGILIQQGAVSGDLDAGPLASGFFFHGTHVSPYRQIFGYTR